MDSYRLGVTSSIQDRDPPESCAQNLEFQKQTAQVSVFLKLPCAKEWAGETTRKKYLKKTEKAGD